MVDAPASAGWLMAVDEALARVTRQRPSTPVLRFYQWQQPSLSIGYFQKIREETDMEACERLGIPVVRRLTGGRAILHGRELTYSLTAPLDQAMFSAGIHRTYEHVSQALAVGLRAVGVSCTFTTERHRPREPRNEDRSPLCFRAISHGEISVGGRKIVGSAQKRWPEAFLQQGSIPFIINAPLTHEVLRFLSEESRKTSLRDAASTMAGLHEFVPDLTTGELVRALVRGFESTLGIALTESTLTPDETALARRLVRERYDNPSWTMRR